MKLSTLKLLSDYCLMALKEWLKPQSRCCLWLCSNLSSKLGTSCQLIKSWSNSSRGHLTRVKLATMMDDWHQLRSTCHEHCLILTITTALFRSNRKTPTTKSKRWKLQGNWLNKQRVNSNHHRCNIQILLSSITKTNILHTTRCNNWKSWSKKCSAPTINSL